MPGQKVSDTKCSAAAVLPTIADEDFRAFAAPELEKPSAKVDRS